MPNYNRMTKKQLIDAIREMEAKTHGLERDLKTAHRCSNKYFDQTISLDARAERYLKQITSTRVHLRATVLTLEFITKVFYPADEGLILYSKNMDRTVYESLEPLPRALRIIYATTQEALAKTTNPEGTKYADKT